MPSGLSRLVKQLLKRRKGQPLPPLAVIFLLLGAAIAGAVTVRVLQTLCSSEAPHGDALLDAAADADSLLPLYRGASQERYGQSSSGLRPVEGAVLLTAPDALVSSAAQDDASLAHLEPLEVDPPPSLPRPVLSAPPAGSPPAISGPVIEPPTSVDVPSAPPRHVPWAESPTVADALAHLEPLASPQGAALMLLPAVSGQEDRTPPKRPPGDPAADATAPQPKPKPDMYRLESGRLLKPITQVTNSLAPPEGQYHPDDVDEDERPALPRARQVFAEANQLPGAGGIHPRPWADLSFHWEASGLCHRPLYFQEVNLERYGYSFRVAQPVVSAAHFFGRIPALPYLMTVDAPHRCVYTLGYYRPGSCVPLAWHLVPFDPLAAAAQAGAVTGLVYLIP